MGRETQLSIKLKLLTAVLVLHLCYAGSHIVTRKALHLGISKLVFLVYRNIVATVFIAPFAYFLEKNDRPPLTFTALIQFFALSLFGIAANQGFYIVGLYYLSPTYASATQNSTPAITFALAAALGIEQLNISKKYGIAKVVGTLVSIGGATILTLYKGPPLLRNGSPHLTVLGFKFFSSDQILNWTLGCSYILLSCVCWSSWMVFQVPVLKKYPARLSLTAFTVLFGLIELIGLAVFGERDLDKWKISSAGEIFTILYAGIVASGIAFSVQIWCIDKAGPLFVVAFQPAQTVMVAVLATILYADDLYSGGLIGFLIIMVGLYTVLWGKNEEKKADQSSLGTEEDLISHLLDQKDHPHIKDMP